jgi:glycosyltransferase involved in cell wall biosynthesis
MKHRVLLTTDAYPPMIGGADRAVRAIALTLADRGHEVAVATAWQPGLPVHELRDGIPVHRVRDLTSRMPWISAEPSKHIPPPFPDPEAVLRLRRLVRGMRPDVVHSYGWFTYSCAAAVARTRIPLILSMRDYGNLCPVRTLIRRGTEPCSGPAPLKCLDCSSRFYGPAKGFVATASVLGGRRPLARSAGGAHFISEFVRSVTWEHLLAGRARFAPGSDLETIAPSFPLEADEVPPDPEILDRLPTEPFILYVGALRRVKGIELLLSAYRSIRPGPPLVLIGTPEIDTPASFPSDVTVLHSVPHGTVMAAWDRALFGVFPSLWAEPLGQVVREAMGRGVPVIGTVPSGHSQMIVDGESGLLVPRGQVEPLAGAMRRLADDAGLRERLGAAARESAGLFTAERIIPRLEGLYDAVVQSARGFHAGGRRR